MFVAKYLLKSYSLPCWFLWNLVITVILNGANIHGFWKVVLIYLLVSRLGYSGWLEFIMFSLPAQIISDNLLTKTKISKTSELMYFSGPVDNFPFSLKSFSQSRMEVEGITDIWSLFSSARTGQWHKTHTISTKRSAAADQKREPSWEAQPGLLQTTALFGPVFMAFISFRLLTSVRNYPSGPGSAGPDTRELCHNSAEGPALGTALTRGTRSPARREGPEASLLPTASSPERPQKLKQGLLKMAQNKQRQIPSQRCQTWSTTLCCEALCP